MADPRAGRGYTEGKPKSILLCQRVREYLKTLKKQQQDKGTQDIETSSKHLPTGQVWDIKVPN